MVLRFLWSLVHRFEVPLDLTSVPVIDNFVGRQAELDSLWQYLKPTDSQSRKVAVLHGLGGMGKTQLAVRFAREHKHDFTTVLWLNGKDRDTLLQSFSSTLSRLPGHSQNHEAINNEELEGRAKQVLRWLATDGNSRWLLIFDNIDQYSPIDSDIDGGYDIGTFFPPADHGFILITSRLLGLTELGRSFPVRKLDLTDAIQLLSQNCGLTTNTTKDLESSPDILTLSSRLDGLPLAITIAAAFMRQTGASVTEYLQYYQESWSDLQLQSSAGRQYQQGNMLQTWMISYREIQKRDPNAAQLLLLLARFDNRDIWYELVKGGQCASNIPSWLKKATSSGLAFKTTLRTLIGFSFLETKQQEGSYAMHPVVKDWCLHIISNDNNVNSIQICELALISVGCIVPGANDKNSSELQRRLIPHANYVQHGELSGNDFAIWRAFHGLGNLYSTQGKLKEANETYQRALAGYEKALGPDHASTLHTVHDLGTLYKRQDKLQLAEKMYQRALAGCEIALGPDHTYTLNVVHSLGHLYHIQDKRKEAEEIYQRALVGFEKVGPDHTHTLDAVHSLGHLYCAQYNKLKEAEEMYQRVLVGYEKALGPDHVSTLAIVRSLGSLYRRQDKLEEAEKMYQRALVGYEMALGPDHTYTLTTVLGLGHLYYIQGKQKEAEAMYQRAIAGHEKTLGPDHTRTLDAVHSLGNLYYIQDKLKEANEMYQRALAGYEKALGSDHASTLAIIRCLGNLYRHQDNLKEAEKMYQRALAGYEKTLGSDHRMTQRVLEQLGKLNIKDGH
ncbi:uncharacterized protein N7484_009078 [Penicillium longicatenatum]|uniref:uncharacterized protein n=1 Tax=Penicillium longicatenatum TaxID=1561947 RepID=UPI00254979E6|nr:uncharacterized protein N7484_009078 [Penicillium longicatenatum]KAJ5635765.1 hypothetical protein N7484_009078 [Penicillium longicatenatum]